MKKFTLLILAIFLAVGMLATPNVWASAQDPTGAPGNLPVPPPTPLINNHGMIGDALLGEFYRAVIDDTFFQGSNVATYVSIENNSNRWVAAHIRLRSGRFSIETIDFPILLSPYDVFWFQFQTTAAPDQKVQIVSKDADTILKSGIQNYTFPTGDTSWDPVTGTLVITLKDTLLKEYNLPAAYQDINELTQGYIEVFGLFALGTTPSIPLIAPGGGGLMGALWKDSTGCSLPGLPADQKYAAYFPDPTNLNSKCYPALDVTKALSGHVFIGDFKSGLYTGYTMKALKDFRAGLQKNTPQRDLAIRGDFNGSGKVLVNPATIIYAYADDDAYTNPDWATSFGPTWNDGDNVLGGPPNPAKTGSYSLDEVDNALFKNIYSSTFFNKGFSGSTYSMIAVTFPTKYLHFFWEGWASVVGRNGLASRRLIDPTTICCYAYGGALWNQAELPAFGPSPFKDGCLKYEVNFLGIGEESQAFFKNFCFLVDDADNIFTVNATTWPAGLFWLSVGGENDGLDCGGSARDPRRAVKDTGLVGCIGVTLPCEDIFGDPRFLIVDGEEGDVYCTGTLCGPLGIDEPLDPGYYFTAVSDHSSKKLLLQTSDAAIASSAQMLDFEDANAALGSDYPHARAFDPSWDNIDQLRDSDDRYGLLGYDGGPRYFKFDHH